MKKVLMIVLAVLISVAFVTTVFAVDKPAVKVETKATVKPKTHQYTGEVTAIDMTAKTLNVKGKKDDKVFDIANAKMKAEPKVGDKVLVTYTEQDGKNVAKTVKITKAAKKEALKKEEPAKTTAPVTPTTPAKK